MTAKTSCKSTDIILDDIAQDAVDIMDGFAGKFGNLAA